MLSRSSITPFLNTLVKLNFINLMDHPIKGNFDLEHLNAVHAALFRNFGEFGLHPGGLREEVREGYLFQRDVDVTWNEKTFKLTYVHARFNAADRQMLVDELAKLKVEEFKKLKTREFADRLSEIFIKVLFLFPYRDMTQPTLMAFFRQFTVECGFDTLFASRHPNNIALFFFTSMKAVNELALTFLEGESAEIIRRHMQAVDKFMDFNQLFFELCRPFTAVVFNNLTADSAEESEGSISGFQRAFAKNSQRALMVYPELSPMVQSFMLSVATTIKSGSSREAQEQTLNKLAHDCIDKLMEGGLESEKPSSLILRPRRPWNSVQA